MSRYLAIVPIPPEVIAHALGLPAYAIVSWSPTASPKSNQPFGELGDIMVVIEHPSLPACIEGGQIYRFEGFQEFQDYFKRAQ